jgi:putative serine protease PepD
VSEAENTIEDPNNSHNSQTARVSNSGGAYNDIHGSNNTETSTASNSGTAETGVAGVAEVGGGNGNQLASFADGALAASSALGDNNRLSASATGPLVAGRYATFATSIANGSNNTVTSVASGANSAAASGAGVPIVAGQRNGAFQPAVSGNRVSSTVTGGGIASAEALSNNNHVTAQALSGGVATANAGASSDGGSARPVATRLPTPPTPLAAQYSSADRSRGLSGPARYAGSLGCGLLSVNSQSRLAGIGTPRWDDRHMETAVLAERKWGLAEATRRLLDTADPSEAGRRDRQIDRAVSAFLAQSAGSVELDDALADQLVILARHFGVEEGYFLDPAIAESSTARRMRQADSGFAPVTPAGRHRAVAADGLTTGGSAPVAPAGRHRVVAGDSPTTGGLVIAGPAFADPAIAGASGGVRRHRRWVGVATVSVAVLAAAVVGGAVGYRMGVGAGRSGSPVAEPVPASRPASAGESPRQVAEKVRQSVVGLRVQAGKVIAAGAGLVLSPHGFLLTDDHVIAAAARPGELSVQLSDGTSRPAHIVGRNPAADLAVLVADHLSGLTPIRAGDSDAVRVGQPVIAIRSPLDLNDPATSGVVSGVVGAVNRAVKAAHGAPKPLDALGAIHTDTKVGPGDSGAPLLGPDGLVIGIETIAPAKRGAAAAALGFAIPINQALRVADQLIDANSATQTSLGVRVATGDRITALHEPPGARVVAVAPDSPASDAGLKVGDILVKVDGRPVTSGDEFVTAIKTPRAHDAVTVELTDGQLIHIVEARRPRRAGR